MRLAAADDVLKVASIPTGVGALASAAAALDAATPIISGLLGTTLHEVVNTDYFNYNPYRGRKTFEPFYLRLSAGFVIPETFVLRESSGGPLTSSEDGTVVPEEDYTLDATRGVVCVLRDLTYGVGTISATYDAGFTTDSNGVADAAPAWLKQAGILGAKRITEMSPAHIAKDKAKVVRDLQNAVFDAVSSIINPHKRPRMGLIWPERTESEDG